MLCITIFYLHIYISILCNPTARTWDKYQINIMRSILQPGPKWHVFTHHLVPLQNKCSASFKINFIFLYVAIYSVMYFVEMKSGHKILLHVK